MLLHIVATPGGGDPLPKADCHCDAKAPEPLVDYQLEDLLAMEATSAAKRPQRVADTAAAIYVITQEDIRRSGARTVADLMRLVPGVDVGSVDGNSSAISIRGFSTRLANSVLVLVDGRAVYLSAFGGVMWDQLLEPLDTIERIEVVRGPGGAVWGANAVNGVINIITKDPSRTADSAAYAAIGTDGMDARLRIGGGAGASRFRLSANGRQTLTPVAGFDGTRDRVISRGLQLTGQSDTILSDRDTLTFRISGSANDFHPLDRRNTATMATGHAGQATLMAQWSRRYSADTTFTLQGYLDHTRRLENGIFPSDGIFVAETVADLSGDLRGRAGRHEIGAGFDVRRTTNRLSSHVPAFDFATGGGNDLLLSGYAQDGFWLIDQRLHGWIGAKAEYSSVTGLAFQPSARLLYRATNALTLWGAWSRAVRTPSLFDRTAIYRTEAGPVNAPFYAPLPVQVTVRSDPNLRAARLEALEAGLRLKIDDSLTLDVTGYRNVYRNLIGYGPTSIEIGGMTIDQATLAAVAAAGAGMGGATMPVQGGASGGFPMMPLSVNYGILNNSTARSMGVEFIATAMLSDTVRFDVYGSAIDLTYDVSGAPNFASLGLPPGLLPQIAPLPLRTLRPVTAGARLRFDPTSRLEFDGSLRWLSDMRYADVRARLGLDIRLSWNVDALTAVTVAGRNLFDRGRIDFQESFPMSAPALLERQVSISLARRF